MKNVKAWREHKPARPFSSSKVTANREIGLLGPYAEEYPLRYKQTEISRPTSNYRTQKRFRAAGHSLGIKFNVESHDHFTQANNDSKK